MGLERSNARRALAVVGLLVVVSSMWAAPMLFRRPEPSLRHRWAVASKCLLGAPLRRTDDGYAIRAMLYERLLDAITELETGSGERALDWPARCAPELAALHDDLPADGVRSLPPERALAQLEQRSRRVFPRGERPIAMARVGRRVAALVEPIAALQVAIAPGAAEHMLTERGALELHEPMFGLSFNAAVLVRTYSCRQEEPTPRRAFLPDDNGGEMVFDEVWSGFGRDRVVTRIVRGRDGVIRVTRRSRTGETIVRELPPRARYPRFLAADAVDGEGSEPIAWLIARRFMAAEYETGQAEFGVEIGHERDAPADALATCGYGDVFAVRSGRRVRVIVPERYPTDRGDVFYVDRTPPRDGVIFACGSHRGCAEASVSVLAWPHDREQWVVVRCAHGLCRPVPRLRAGPDLRFAILDEIVLALARGVRSDLIFGRVLQPNGWSAPTPAPSGEVIVREQGSAYFMASSCRDVAMSIDGLQWRAYFDP